jgi:hypothetical protein
MTAWDALDRELDKWAESDRTATMWWRDDDAAASSDALIRVLTLADAFDVSVALAVIPARLDATLGPLIARHPRAVVMQHGYAHDNHARAGDKKIELGPQRPFMHSLADLAAGWQRLEHEIGPRAIAVLVPPWNRIAPGLVPLLPEVGFRGLSMFGSRRRRPADGRLNQANAHVDIIEWRQSRAFVGQSAALMQVIAHLEARRSGQADPAEVTGLMTHHAGHDAECWRFVEALLTRTRNHAAVRWLAATEVFESTGGTGADPHGSRGD